MNQDEVHKHRIFLLNHPTVSPEEAHEVVPNMKWIKLSTQAEMACSEWPGMAQPNGLQCRAVDLVTGREVELAMTNRGWEEQVVLVEAR